MGLGADPVVPTVDPATPQPMSDQDKWRWLMTTANEAARVRRVEGNFDQLDRWLDLYYGDHYPSTMPTYRPPVVVNELRTLVLSESSDLSDINFRAFIMKDLRHGNRDEITERALRAVWSREQVDLKLIEALCWAAIMGTGFLRVSWDPDASNGMGDVVVEALDPRAVLPDPDAPNDRKMMFVIYRSVLDLTEIRRLWPWKGKEVEPEMQYSEPDRQGSASEGSGWPYYGPMSSNIAGFNSGADGMGYKRARAEVYDMLIYDDTTETVVEQITLPGGIGATDAEGQPRVKSYKRMKYPKGRRITGANGVILYDGPNNEPDFGLIRVVLEPTLGRFWGGRGFVQQTGELQLAADKTASAIVENMIRLNNGILVVKGQTGLDWETFAGIPGQIVQLNMGGDFDIKYPNPMPPEMVQAPQMFLDLQRRILGFAPARMGQGGRGNVSPELTETEISQSQGPTRLRAKHLYFAVQRLCEMITARMMEKYTTPRAIPATEGESFKPVIWEPVDPTRNGGKGYSVYVDPASFQVMSRSMLRRLSLALFRMGAIDRHAVLETLGWPHWEEVAQRQNEAEKAMAMAQLQAKKKKG